MPPSAAALRSVRGAYDAVDPRHDGVTRAMFTDVIDIMDIKMTPEEAALAFHYAVTSSSHDGTGNDEDTKQHIDVASAATHSSSSQRRHRLPSLKVSPAIEARATLQGILQWYESHLVANPPLTSHGSERSPLVAKARAEHPTTRHLALTPLGNPLPQHATITEQSPRIGGLGVGDPSRVQKSPSDSGAEHFEATRHVRDVDGHPATSSSGGRTRRVARREKEQFLDEVCANVERIARSPDDWDHFHDNAGEVIVLDVLRYCVRNHGSDARTILQTLARNVLGTHVSDLTALATIAGAAATDLPTPALPAVSKMTTKNEEALLTFASTLVQQHLSNAPEALWRLDAAVMFVDISGYSSVAHVLGDRGPHVFAGVVNSYLEIIVNKVREYGGDVVKFSGDALMVMWYSDQPRSNARAAASCAVGLLNSRCAAHPVEDTELTFGLHVGISAGTVISHIFAPRASTKDLTTPSHFHFLTGDPVPTVSIACGIAKRGEVVVCSRALELIGSGFTETQVYSDNPHYHYLTDVQSHVRVIPPKKLQSTATALMIIPPPIAARVTAGINPFYLAEMRDLVVLFIHLGVDTDEQIWFDEVFRVLANASCSVVQIIDDDKGVHVVAAFNLYVMHGDSADRAIGVASTLRSMRSDCHIGVAVGPVLCGVLGSREACQWDITGAACVRACRLMQHAEAVGKDVMFDESLFHSARDRSQLVREDPTTIKGSESAVAVFSLRDTPLETQVPMITFSDLCYDVHTNLRHQIEGFISYRIERLQSGAPNVVPKRHHGIASPSNPSAIPPACVVLCGAPGTGKVSLCLNSVKKLNLVPIVHTAGHDRRHVELDVINTLVLWLRTQPDDDIKAICGKTRDALSRTQYNLAFKLGIELLDKALDTGFRCAVIVRHGQFLDHHSAVFLRTVTERYCENGGVFLFVTCSPQYNNRHPEDVFRARWGTKTLTVEEATHAEIKALVEHVASGSVSVPLLDLITERSGRFVECAVELTRYVLDGGVAVNRSGELSVSSRRLEELREVPWDQISPTIKMKCIHQVDHLPPFLLTMAKIICAITEQPDISAYFYAANRVCESQLGESLNVGFLEILSSLKILRLCEHKCTVHTGTGELDAAVFYMPAMRDVLQCTLVPQQRVQINRICGDAYADTHPMDHPMQYLVRARHYLFGDNRDRFLSDMWRGWELTCTNMTGEARKSMQRLLVRWFLRADDYETVRSNFDGAPSGSEARHILKMLHHVVSRNVSLTSLGPDVTNWLYASSPASLVPSLAIGPGRAALLRLLHLARILLENADMDNVASSGMVTPTTPHSPMSTPSPSSSSMSRSVIPRPLCTETIECARSYISFIKLNMELMPKSVQAQHADLFSEITASIDVLLDPVATRRLMKEHPLDGDAQSHNDNGHDDDDDPGLVLTNVLIGNLRTHIMEVLPKMVETQRSFDAVGFVRDALSALPEGHHLDNQDALLEHLAADDYGGTIAVVTSLYGQLPAVYRRLCPDDAMLQDALYGALRVMYDGLHVPVCEQEAVRHDFFLFLTLWFTAVGRWVSSSSATTTPAIPASKVSTS
eukprot:PhM_4_TR3048/c0_g1_i6/m.45202